MPGHAASRTGLPVCKAPSRTSAQWVRGPVWLKWAEWLPPQELPPRVPAGGAQEPRMPRGASRSFSSFPQKGEGAGAHHQRCRSQDPLARAPHLPSYQLSISCAPGRPWGLGEGHGERSQTTRSLGMGPRDSQGSLFEGCPQNPLGAGNSWSSPWLSGQRTLVQWPPLMCLLSACPPLPYL